MLPKNVNSLDFPLLAVKESLGVIVWPGGTLRPPPRCGSRSQTQHVSQCHAVWLIGGGWGGDSWSMGPEKLVAIENQGFSKEGRSFRLRVSGTLALCGRSPGSVGAPLVRQREAAVRSALRRSRPARALASVPAPARARMRCPRVATDEFHVTEDRIGVTAFSVCSL